VCAQRKWINDVVVPWTRHANGPPLPETDPDLLLASAPGIAVLRLSFNDEKGSAPVIKAAYFIPNEWSDLVVPSLITCLAERSQFAMEDHVETLANSRLVALSHDANPLVAVIAFRALLKSGTLTINSSLERYISPAHGITRAALFYILLEEFPEKNYADVKILLSKIIQSSMNIEDLSAIAVPISSAPSRMQIYGSHATEKGKNDFFENSDHRMTLREQLKLTLQNMLSNRRQELEGNSLVPAQTCYSRQ
jgi:hypothetical protein